MPSPKTHEYYIRQTLKLARKGVGKTKTNPLVGAILVRHTPNGDQIIGRGYHTGYGKPHAEVEAVRDAQRRGVTDFKNTILYVNLEPCCHTGKTPPCTSLILQEKIPRVVFGIKDPFPAVAGKG
ncbi:MAG TPA: deaminase, partial [bacterium]|nr:deaminase [bacterium]